MQPPPARWPPEPRPARLRPATSSRAGALRDETSESRAARHASTLSDCVSGARGRLCRTKKKGVPLFKKIIPAFGLLAALSLVSAAPAGKAKATLKDAQGKEVGTASISQAKDGVVVALNLKGVPAGDHAIHIHAVGKCEAPGFTTAGGHFNPEKKQHGMHNPQGSHAGDLENLTVGAKGTLKKKIAVKGVTLADGPNSLFHEGGTAIVIHAAADDYKTDPAGNAGARIVCGVIER